MKKFAVIVAGGAGTRMGGEIPKQFLLLRDKPVFYYSARTFLDAFPDLQVVLVFPADHIEKGKELVQQYFPKHRVQVTGGGETRFHSVKNGLERVTGESIIFVHDAVRCLLSKELVHRCYEKAMEKGSAIPAVPSRDSVRIIKGDDNEAIDRNRVMLVQTPQTFHSKILLPAFQIDYKDKFTDEATVVESFGIKVYLVEGEESNIKITRPVDLVLAERLLQ